MSRCIGLMSTGLISTSPESISRLISDFKAKGIIQGKGQSIEILNLDELEGICNCESLDIYKI
jgi:hypothetical protein